MTLVREYMTPNVVSVDCQMSLDDVVKTLVTRNVSCVLVVEGGEPRGVISMTDLVRVSKLVPEAERRPLRLAPPNMKARDVMVKGIVAVPEDASVGEAAKKMLEGHIHRLFVRHAGGAVTGVFSARDAMRVVLDRHVETPLKQVMRSPVETVGIGESIDDALAKLDEKNLRGLVVLDGKVPVGIFAQLEAIKARSLPANVRSNPVEEMMSYEHCSLEAATPLYRAAGQAIATNVRRILVTDQRALVGVVTGYDVAKVLIDR